MMKMKQWILAVPAVVLAGMFSTFTASQSRPMPEQSSVTRAVCVLHATQGNQARGTVTFTKDNGGMRVVADMEGLAPGEHGFHIHEFGDCSAPDGTSAGGHFNPDNKRHGGPNDSEHHAGDLGNITAGKDGKAHLVLVSSDLAFSGSHSIIGRGIIVHALPDDFKTQPTGNAGARVACGVIGIAR